MKQGGVFTRRRGITDFLCTELLTPPFIRCADVENQGETLGRRKQENRRRVLLYPFGFILFWEVLIRVIISYAGTDNIYCPPGRIMMKRDTPITGHGSCNRFDGDVR